jgi:Na+-transporting NADH:ubiquinone oxidoreductase subunit NqrB
MSADDLFMGWAFMIVIGPFWGMIHAIVALPSTLLSIFVHHRAGFIAWVLTMLAIFSLIIFKFGDNGRYDTGSLITGSIFFLSFLVLPQAAAYPLTRQHPWRRPLVAGGFAIGVALLYMLLGFLTGATPD